jgi:hypothetical protein
MSAFGGKADIDGRCSNVCFWTQSGHLRLGRTDFVRRKGRDGITTVSFAQPTTSDLSLKCAEHLTLGRGVTADLCSRLQSSSGSREIRRGNAAFDAPNAAPCIPAITLPLAF